MRAPRLSYAASLVLSFVLAACGPSRGGGDDDGGDDDPNACSGDEERCVGTLFQVCVDGEFVTGETCTTACRADLGGCVQCDPAAGNGCNGNDVVTCNPDGTLGDVVETCGGGLACSGGECTRECTADGVDLIYVVDDSYRLYSYDPRLQMQGMEPFSLIGDLDCPASSTPVPGWLGDVTPFSMSVDRSGRAWVLYASGEIFYVDVTTGQCTASTFQPRQGTDPNRWDLFGMGFVTDTAGGNTERLFIGGGSPEADPGGLFGSVDPTSLAVQTHGNLPNVGEYSPEFTGTGNAELFGFFPGGSQAFVQQIDKTTGAVTGNQMAIPGGLGGAGTTVVAWAFAHWGGQFYIFVTTADFLGAENSTVRRIDRATGQYELLTQNLPYNIVGAGVSTCAPVVVD